MSSPKVRLALILTILVHGILAFWFASATPYRTPGRYRSMGGAKIPDIGAPDERQHVNYAWRLARGEGIPVFQPGAPDLGETYQSHQPPLFYALEAAWSKIVSPGFATQSQTGEDRFKSVPTDNGIALRALNVLIGCGSVAATFWLGICAFADEKRALLGAAFVAVLPMFLALSGSVSNDPLLVLLCTSALALICLASQEGWSTRRAIAIGGCIGLAALTKTTAVTLFIPLGIAAIASKRDSSTLKSIAVAIGVALLFAAPWWARNQSLYGDPLAMRAFNAAFVGSPQASAFINELGPMAYWLSWVGWWTARSFIGAFGYMDIFLNEKGVPGADTPNTLYRLILALLFVAIIGFVASLRGEDKRDERKVHLILGSFALVVFVVFLKFNAQYFQAQARYLAPAIAPIGLAIGTGVLHLTKNRAKLAAGAIFAVLGGTALYALNILPGEFAKRMEPLEAAAPNP